MKATIYVQTQGPVAAADVLTRLIERLLWGMFLCFLFCGLTLPAEQFAIPPVSYRLCNGLTYVLAISVLLLVVRNLRVLWWESCSLNPVFRLLPLLIVIISLGLVTGLVLSTGLGEYLHAVGYEFLPMCSVLLVLIGPRVVTNPDSLMKALAIQSLLGGIFAIYTVVQYPVIEGRAEILSPHFFAFNLVTFSAFTLAYLRHYNRWYQIAVMVGYGGLAYLTLAYQSRGGSFIVFVLFPLVFLVTQWREGIGGVFNVTTITAGLVFLAVAGYWVQRPESQLQIQAGFDGTMTRLLGGEQSSGGLNGLQASVSDEYEYSRGAEAMEFIDKSTWVTWTCGRGWGGGWSSLLMSSGDQWSMVHFGPLHLVLKGGIGLLVLLHVFIFGALWRSWTCIGYDTLAAPSFCYLMIYYAGFLKHGPVLHTYVTYVTWVVIGIALCCRRWYRPGTPLATAHAMLEPASENR